MKKKKNTRFYNLTGLYITVIISILLIGIFNILTTRISGEGKIKCDTGKIGLSIKEIERSVDSYKSECMRECYEKLDIVVFDFGFEQDDNYQQCFNDCKTYIDKNKIEYSLNGIENLKCEIEGKSDIPLILSGVLIDG